MRVLLIEDDKQLAQTLHDELRIDYIVDISNKGREGEELANLNSYDLIIVDLMLPDKNGIDICRDIRRNGVRTPILVLTAQNAIATKVMALDCGADDYVTKPFTLVELKARLRALLRRHSLGNRTNTLSVGDLTLDIEKRIVKRDNLVIKLRRKELALLEYLMRNEGRVVTRDMILDHVWSDSSESFHNIVDVHIKLLRDRIDNKFEKKLIKTLYGVGYKIEV